MAQNWYRLDNAGMVYSAIQRDDYSAVYRFSAVMDAPVDPPAPASGRPAGDAPLSRLAGAAAAGGVLVLF